MARVAFGAAVRVPRVAVRVGELRVAELRVAELRVARGRFGADRDVAARVPVVRALVVRAAVLEGVGRLAAARVDDAALPRAGLAGAARDAVERVDFAGALLVVLALLRVVAAATFEVRPVFSGALRLAAVAVAFVRAGGLARAGAFAVAEARVAVLLVFAGVVAADGLVTREPVRAPPRVVVARRPPARIAIGLALLGPLSVSSVLM